MAGTNHRLVAAYDRLARANHRLAPTNDTGAATRGIITDYFLLINNSFTPS
ncbi:hypothetical protein [uncultured Alloprevotella sp.]|uniref:hypothetical protein n=1 Tax=uncultured Alloprevotella sp. TaxID=1283315 RepID=UPI002630C7B7|nr:hypothetical protein [uncultured Alloprevotella sp.]